jgi:fatty-acyl-CoA synthase
VRTCIGLFLQKRAQLEPDRTGLIFEGSATGYRAWSERAGCAAHAFAHLGVAPGDRVGLLLENCPEFLDCFFALTLLGAIAVPLNWRLSPRELAYIAADADICALVSSAKFTSAIEEIADSLPADRLIAVGGTSVPGWRDYDELLQAGPQSSWPSGTAVAGADDPALIIYTSGTTGRPKGAVLSHNNLFHGALNICISLDWRAGDRALVAMPLFHIGALIVSLINVYLGATTVLMRNFDPDAFLRDVEHHRIDSFVAVEAMLQMLTAAKTFSEADLSSVRWVLSGPTPPSLKMAWAKRGIVIRQVYGMTETTGGAAVIAGEHVSGKPDSTGPPMFHTDLRIVDPDGRDCEAEQVGEILISGPHVMQAYWNNPTATAQALQDGWLKSGDLGKRDQDGYLYVVGRRKDMIRSGGENIYPAELEAVLSEMPQIREVAVVGVPDSAWGESICAVVRLHAGQTLTLDELAACCAAQLGKYKIPRRLVITEVPFPRGPSGRMQKQELVKALGESGVL